MGEPNNYPKCPVIDEIKWEMEILLETKRILTLRGRDIGYFEDKRLETLRARLDRQLGQKTEEEAK